MKLEEKFSIRLEADISGVNKALDRVKNMTQSFGNRQKLNLGVDGAQFELMSNRLGDLRTELEWLLEQPAGAQSMAVMQVRAEIEKLEQQLEKAQPTAKSFFDQFKKNTEKSFSKGLKKVRRFTLALFGVHSVYRMLTRASNAYLAQDEETANKIRSAWVGLGAIFAPLLQRIADFTLKAVKYLDAFWTAFTGKGFLSSAMEKASKKASKAVGALNKQLAGFDEITNIGDSGGGSLAEPSWVQAFEDVEVNTEWMDRIQAFGGWFKENWGGVIGGLAGVATTIGLIKLGVDGIMALGIGIAVFSLIHLIKETIKYLNDPTFNRFGEVLFWLGGLVLGLGVAFGSIPVIVAGVLIAVVGLFTKNFDNIRNNVTNFFDGIQTKLNNLPAIFRVPLTWINNYFRDFTLGLLNGFKGWVDGVKQVLDGLIRIFKGDFANGFLMIGKGIANAIISIVNTVINSINVLVSPIRALVVAVGKVTGKNWTMDNIRVPLIPKLASGTNYVPEDTLAYLHKGEAVVPKRFNSEGYGIGGDETNTLLRAVIEAVEQIEINPVTTIKDVGQASVGYIRQQRRILGKEVL